MITLSLLASIDVFKSGADGYNCYRIPSMITLPSGRIFAFAEGRLHDCYDGPNHKIDVVFKSSDDNAAASAPLARRASQRRRKSLEHERLVVGGLGRDVERLRAGREE